MTDLPRTPSTANDRIAAALERAKALGCGVAGCGCGETTEETR